MFKKIIFVVLLIELIVFGYMNAEKFNASLTGYRNMCDALGVGRELNEREMRIYEEFGSEVAYRLAGLREDCEFRNDTIINEYVLILEDEYEYVVRVIDKTGEKYEYFDRITK